MKFKESLSLSSGNSSLRSQSLVRLTLPLCTRYYQFGESEKETCESCKNGLDMIILFYDEKLFARKISLKYISYMYY